MNYSLAKTGFEMPSDLSFSVQPAAPAPAPSPAFQRPLFGPEIGPDPRNASQTILMAEVPTQQGPRGVRFDFCFGFRVMLPQEGIGACELIVEDDDSGMPLFQGVLQPGQMAVGDRKYFIRYRMKLRAVNEEKPFWDYRFDCRDKVVCVIVPDGGLGDNLAWMPFAERFRTFHGAKVRCIAGEWLIRLVQPEYPELEFAPVGQTSEKILDAYAIYFCAIFGADRRAWRPIDHQQLGMQRSVAAILGLPLDEEPKIRLVPTPSERVIPGPYVCISAMATNPSKHWNYPDGWNKIIRYLKRIGYRVAVIDRDREFDYGTRHCHVPEEAEDFTGVLPLFDRIAMLRQAEFFIGLPSGLSWLAWACDIPVVLISGFSMPNCEFPTPYRVTNYHFCHGCWNDSGCFFDMTAPVWCPRHLGTPREIECTRMISPRMVKRAIDRIPAVAARLAKFSEPPFCEDCGDQPDTAQTAKTPRD